MPDYRPILTLRLYDAHVAYGWDTGFPLGGDYLHSKTVVSRYALERLARAFHLSFKWTDQDADLELETELSDWPGHLDGKIELSGCVIAHHHLDLRLWVEWKDEPGKVAVYEFTYCGAFGVQWKTEDE